MHNTKRILLLVLALIMAFGVVEAASAATINFTFTNFQETNQTRSTSVSKFHTEYTVKIDSSSTVSTVNIFGFRARRADKNGLRVSPYKTMNYTGTRTVSYYTDELQKDTGDSNTVTVFLKGKKDSSSTYGGPLNVWGTFTP